MNELDQPLDNFSQTVVTQVRKAYPEAIQQVLNLLGEPTVVVNRAFLVDICAFLRDQPDLAFNVLVDLSAVDMWPEDPRFEVNVHLLALPQHPQPCGGTRRLRIKIRLDENDAKMTSLTTVWPAAAWYERETAELFGIEFLEHPDMRPLLLPDDWKGAPPMRRDVPVHVEEVAFSFNQDRIYAKKPFVKE